MFNLIIITPYPEKNKYDHTSSALASFSSNLVEAMGKNNKNLKITVLADRINEDNQHFVSNNLVIKRVWEKNSLSVYFDLIKNIVQENSEKVLIQFEWSVFGNGLFYLIFFPVFLLILRGLGKKIYLVLHGVAFDFSSLKIFNQSKSIFYSFMAKIFYFLLILFSYKTIVLELKLKKIIGKITFNKKKVVFIPHGVDDNLRKIDIKKQGFILEYFGFINPYKGTDLLANIYRPKKGEKLIIAGGPSPNLMNDNSYKKYIKKFYKSAFKKKIKITGFVSNKYIPHYLSLADLLIFPYRSFISSSGPLSLAFSYEKPFILSRPMIGYFESPDFADALRQTVLKKEDFLFDFNQESFEKRLTWAKKNLDKLAYFSRIMKEQRAWKKIAKQYEKLLE